MNGSSRRRLYHTLGHGVPCLAVLVAAGAGFNRKEVAQNTESQNDGYPVPSRHDYQHHHYHRHHPLANAAPRSPVRILRCYNSNLQVAYDTRTRNPVYVLERLDGSTARKNGRRGRRANFFLEPRLPAHFQSKNSHYQNSGYDRGHMAPAADFLDENDVKETFSLANISPQDPDVNRGLWAQLEAWTRRVAEEVASRNDKNNDNSMETSTFVVTGPLWLPAKQLSETKFQYEYPALGRPPEMCAVPTHFFKVVVVAKHSKTSTLKTKKDAETLSPQIQSFACFVVPNKWEDNKARSLTEYLVCWTDLEAATGLEFFAVWKGVDSTWKVASNDLTLAEMQGTPLLLPEKTSSNKNSNKSTDDNNNKIHQLEHLCSNGNCRLGAGQRF